MDLIPYPTTDDDKSLPRRNSCGSRGRFSRNSQKRYSDPRKRYSGLSQKRWSQLSSPPPQEKFRNPDESETNRLGDLTSQTSHVFDEVDHHKLSWKDDGAEKGLSPDESPSPPQDSPTTSPREDPNLVSWDGPGDPANPQNWILSRKLYITLIWIYATMVTTISSSIFASGALEVVRHFHVSPTVATLGVSLFLLVSP